MKLYIATSLPIKMLDHGAAPRAISPIDSPDAVANSYREQGYDVVTIAHGPPPDVQLGPDDRILLGDLDRQKWWLI